MELNGTFFKIRQREVVGDDVPMRKVEPKRDVASEAKTTSAAKYCVVDAELFGDIGSPTKKDVRDDTEWGAAMAASCESLYCFFERGFELERGGSLIKAKDEVIRKGIEVFRVRWEAMGGA